MQEMTAPESVSKAYSRYWWSLVAFYIVMVVCRFYAGDIWGGIVSLFMGVWSWFLVSQSMKNMTQGCLMIFGVFTIFQFIMDLIIVLSAVRGRASEQESATPIVSANGATTINYSITITNHPFFSGKMGFMYNFQSALLIVIPVMDLCGLALAYFTYNAFPHGMFGGDDDAEAGRSFGSGGYPGGYGGVYGGRGSGGGGYGGGGGGSSGGRPYNPRPASGNNTNTFQTFQGSGNRLGS